MSEIISSVYELMENTGIQNGILFLDEINCVSETLTPIMLQFLQYKVFGRHEVPAGWIVVTAGNPPEYNRSVREFDIATSRCGTGFCGVEGVRISEWGAFLDSDLSGNQKGKFL